MIHTIAIRAYPYKCKGAASGWFLSKTQPVTLAAPVKSFRAIVIM